MSAFGKSSVSVGRADLKRLDAYNVGAVSLKFGKIKSENYLVAQKYELLDDLNIVR